MRLHEWFLSAEERGNPATELDSRHPDGLAWTTGNEVRPLVHGATYFAELLTAIRRTRAGDSMFFTDWRGDPDERLSGPGTEVSRVLSDAARRGVLVRGLMWRSHRDRLGYHEGANRHLGEEVQAAGGECLLDMRVRAGGSHHQKLVVLRYRDRPELDVAYLGGIDLCHGRRDDHAHLGDEQPCRIGRVYGTRPAWHDVQVAVRGPAVADLEAAFRERWDDPAPLSRNPYRRWRDRNLRPIGRKPCPPRLPDPPDCGIDAVQVLRTYPYRRRGYSFAPAGERSIARAYGKVVRQARQLIYVEDQYLWSPPVIGVFAAALAANPDLRMIAVVPHHPVGDSPAYTAPQLLARAESVRRLRDAGGDRFAVYGLENSADQPIYVHAKVGIVDDQWLIVGSGNLNLRSWTYDSELSCAVMTDPAGDSHDQGLAQRVRLALAREHLGWTRDDTELIDPVTAFDAFAQSAKELEAWHHNPTGLRPDGRLRPFRPLRPSRRTRWWAGPLFRTVYDPDGRAPRLRRQCEF